MTMESTGVFWKPIFNILEERFTVLLVNARHLETSSRRKSDIRDCQWIAQLLQYGLLKGSFIPPRPQRELRDLTRYRARLVEEKTRTMNRLQKVLEDANIKLGAVASDALGVSGRAMIHRLIEGETDPHKLADLAMGQLRGKIPELEKALEGHVTEHHQFLPRMLWQQLAQQEAWIAEVDAQIQERTRPFATEIERLDAVPGVNHQVAEVLLAEVGPDMSPFPTHRHLASWAGMCPGNEESAGSVEENASRRAIAGSKRLWCKQAGPPRIPGTAVLPLSTGAWPDVAVRSALVAVGHSLLVIFYHMMRRAACYTDLGGDFFERLEPNRLKHYYVQRLVG